MDQLELQAEVLTLQRRIKFLLAIIRLAFLLVRLSGFRLDSQRVPEPAANRSILNAVAHATKAIPLAVALRVLRLSAARYHEWNKRPQDCSLEDRPSCPRTSPTQVTAKEIFNIKDMVVPQEHRHMSIIYTYFNGAKPAASLAEFQRLGDNRISRLPEAAMRSNRGHPGHSGRVIARYWGCSRRMRRGAIEWTFIGWNEMRA